MHICRYVASSRVKKKDIPEIPSRVKKKDLPETPSRFKEKDIPETSSRFKKKNQVSAYIVAQHNNKSRELPSKT